MFLSYFLFIFMYLLGVYVFKVINKIEIKGKENLPRTTKILYVSNHLTFIDSLIIGIGVISLKELLFYPSHIPWNAPDFKNFYSKKIGVFFMKLLKNVPVDRRRLNNEEYVEFLIKRYCKILRKSALLLFPEGGRTKNNKGEVMDRCKSGVAMTILRMTKEDPDFVVIPIYLDGINEIMPREVGQKYSRIKSGKKGKMIIGKLINFSEICDQDIAEKEKIKLIKEKVRDSILALKQ